VLLNIAAGVTPIRARDVLAGTALGSTPKIVLVAFAGDAVIGAPALTAMPQSNMSG
jgi:uncharacterized membrane protein YdjX (TVP38/TMEM64 family)